MTTVYHELLPDSYLLILAPGMAGASEAALAHSLCCAKRSGKPAVWVDCSQLKSITEEAAGLLWASYHDLQANHTELVLVHVPENVRHELLARELGPAPSMVPTLLDAARHQPSQRPA